VPSLRRPFLFQKTEEIKKEEISKKEDSLSLTEESMKTDILTSESQQDQSEDQIKTDANELLLERIVSMKEQSERIEMNLERLQELTFPLLENSQRDVAIVR
jgi:hypothetical protein